MGEAWVKCGQPTGGARALGQREAIDESPSVTKSTAQIMHMLHWGSPHVLAVSVLMHLGMGVRGWDEQDEASGRG